MFPLTDKIIIRTASKIITFYANPRFACGTDDTVGRLSVFVGRKHNNKKTSHRIRAKKKNYNKKGQIQVGY